MPRTKYRSPYPRRLHIQFGFDRPSGFEQKMFEIVYDDGRTPARGYTISSPSEPNGSGELKMISYNTNLDLVNINVHTNFG